VSKLLFVKAKHEVGRKSILIAPHRLKQDFVFNAIEFSQLEVEHYRLSAKSENSVFNRGEVALGVAHKPEFRTPLANIRSEKTLR